MKLFLSQKKKRRILFAVAGLICGVLVWWAQICDPLYDRKSEMVSERESLLSESVQLREKLKKLTEFIESHKSVETEMGNYEGLKVEGKTIEALNSATQAILQQFMDKHTIPIKAYKELPASKWRDHPVSLIELQIETRTQGISDLLEFLESLNKVVRIDRLTVSYRRMKDTDLLVSIQIATLQMEGLTS